MEIENFIHGKQFIFMIYISVPPEAIYALISIDWLELCLVSVLETVKIEGRAADSYGL